MKLRIFEKPICLNFEENPLNSYVFLKFIVYLRKNSSKFEFFPNFLVKSTACFSFSSKHNWQSTKLPRFPIDQRFNNVNAANAINSVARPFLNFTQKMSENLS